MDLPPPGERIRFRPLVAADARQLCDVFSDALARRFYPNMDQPLAERWIKKNQQRYADDGFGLWAVVLRTSGQMIGDCGLTRQTVPGGSEIEVGYHLHADHRGRGLAREAAAICLKFGLARIEVPRIVSFVHNDNISSQRVARRIHTGYEEITRHGSPHRMYFTVRPAIS